MPAQRRSRSPGIDVRTLFAGACRGRGRRAQPRENPAARFDRIDHIVELEMRGAVERLALLIHPRHHLLEQLLARARFVDRLQFLAITELGRTLQSHPAELAGWPRNREYRRLEAAPGHRLRAQAVA